MRVASAAAIARATARTSVWRSESQTKRPLIARDRTVRSRIFADRIGALALTRRDGDGLLFVALVVPGRRGRRFRGRTGDPVRAGEPSRQVERPAARRAEGERLVLLARLDDGAAGRAAGHAVSSKVCLRTIQHAGFRTTGQASRLTPLR